MEKVYVFATTEREAGVAQSFDALAPASLAGKRTLVKPNFNTADPTPGSTHHDTLSAILDGARRRNPKALAVGDRSAPETAGVLREKGVHALASAYEAEVLDFDLLPEGDWIHFDPPGSHWPEGFRIARPVLETDYLVWSPCLKPHQFGGVFTMSLKLAVGVVPRRGYPYMTQLHQSPHQRKMIAEINPPFCPDLIILDGVTAFTDGGPAEGTRKDLGIFIAGRDRIAVDAVGLAALKHAGTKPEIADVPIFAQEQLARAIDLGLGITGPEDIDLIAGDDGSRDITASLQTILASG